MSTYIAVHLFKNSAVKAPRLLGPHPCRVAFLPNPPCRPAAARRSRARRPALFPLSATSAITSMLWEPHIDRPKNMEIHHEPSSTPPISPTATRSAKTQSAARPPPANPRL